MASYSLHGILDLSLKGDCWLAVVMLPLTEILTEMRSFQERRREHSPMEHELV